MLLDHFLIGVIKRLSKRVYGDVKQERSTFMNINPPLVSVCLITYNHEKFIRRAIESVLNQKVNFKYELVIGEDDSNDGTRAICKVLAGENPDLIKLKLRDRADVIYKYGKPTGISNIRKTLEDCEGKYIAMLDGDDYWTSIHKLQFQFDLMENQRKYSAVFHDTHFVGPNDALIIEEDLQEAESSEEYYLDKVLASGSVAPTAALFFRRELIFPLPKWYTENPSDWKIEIMLAMNAPLLKIKDKLWSAYTIHEGGIWSSETIERQLKYRLDQVNDLYAEPAFQKQKDSLDRYKAKSYEFGYQKLMHSKKKMAFSYLWLFVKLSNLSPWIKIKHLIKTSFRILIR